MFEKLKKWWNTKSSTETNHYNKQRFSIGNIFSKIKSFLRGLKPYRPKAVDKIDLEGRDSNEVVAAPNIDTQAPQNVRIVETKNEEKAKGLQTILNNNERPSNDFYHSESARKSILESDRKSIDRPRTYSL